MGGERPRVSTNALQHPDHPPAHTTTVSHHTPPLPPTPATLTPEHEHQAMPLFPQRRRPALRAAGSHALATGDQRLTKLDKTCHRQPLRRIPNNPEQIRTDPNKPEHRRTPRPDRGALRITPEQPEKNEPEHRRRPPQRPTPPPHRGEGLNCGKGRVLGRQLAAV